MAISAGHIGQNLQPFTDKGDVSKWVKYSQVWGKNSKQKHTNKQKKWNSFVISAHENIYLINWINILNYIKHNILLIVKSLPLSYIYEALLLSSRVFFFNIYIYFLGFFSAALQTMIKTYQDTNGVILTTKSQSIHVCLHSNKCRSCFYNNTKLESVYCKNKCFI